MPHISLLRCGVFRVSGKAARHLLSRSTRTIPERVVPPNARIYLRGSRPLFFCRQLVHSLAWFAFAGALHAQAVPAAGPVATSSATNTSEVPKVPGLTSFLRGFNAGITFSGQHDAQNGYATIAQPAVGYTFSPIFSFDITMPIYLYRLAAAQDLTIPLNQRTLSPQHGEIGDTLFGFHAQFFPRHFDYQATISATAPTGDLNHGLSSGRATVDFSNHLAHTYRHVSPYIEIGIGDSSTLADPLLNRNFTTLGPLAHFQAGAAFPLMYGASFATNAYEQLPIGDQKIYETIARPNAPTLTVIAGRGISEDNGFTNTLDIPVGSQTTISGYYNRSLRFRDDTVSFGITFVLRGNRHSSLSDDELLRAINQEIQKPAPTGHSVNP